MAASLQHFLQDSQETWLMVDRNLIASVGAGFILKMRGIPAFSHGDQQPSSLYWPGLIKTSPLGVLISKYLCEMRKHKGNTKFPLFSWKVQLHGGTSAGKVLNGCYKITQETLGKHRAGLYWGIQYSWCESEWAPSRLVFLERWGWSGGNYSSQDVWEGTHGKCVEPPLTLTETKTTSLIHDCQLEKPRQTLKSSV